MEREAPLPSVPLALFQWALCGASSALMLTLAAFVVPFARRRAMHLYRRWAQLQCWVFGLDVETTYARPCGEDDGAFVFVQLNQSSLTETFALPVGTPLAPRILINLEYALIPFLGLFLIASGCVVVVRQWPRQAKRAVERAVRGLKAGGSLFLSIEGKRSEDGHLSPYKKGPVILAIDAQVPLVPYVIEGARECLPAGQWRVRPGTIRVRYLAPVQTAGMDRADRHALVDTLRDVAERELGERPS